MSRLNVSSLSKLDVTSEGTGRGLDGLPESLNLAPVVNVPGRLHWSVEYETVLDSQHRSQASELITLESETLPHGLLISPYWKSPFSYLSLSVTLQQS